MQIKYFFWKAASNALPTGENLRKRGLLLHTTCVRCGAPESVEHIIFHCQFAIEVWSYSSWNLTIDTTSATNFFEKLDDSWKKTPLPPYGFTGNAFPWLCWFLWIAQNKVIFENRTQSPQDLVLQALLALKEWESAQPLKPPILLAPTQYRHNLSSIRPEIFCNTDASWRHSSREAGLAWIFTDRDGSELARGSAKQSSVSSPCMGEALAIREALLQAASRNYFSICIRTDSQVLTQAINSRRKTMELYGVLSDIDDLSFSVSSPFNSCRFMFIPRASNGPADSLAKACLASHVLLDLNSN